MILTIHQPSSRIQLLVDHLIILARGQLMYQGSPQDVTLHLSRMGRKVPKEENSIEYLIDVIQKYDQSEHGVEALAQFVLTGVRPPKLSNEDMSASTIVPTPPQPLGNRLQSEGSSKRRNYGKRLPVQTSTDEPNSFDHSVSPSWSGSHIGGVQRLRFTSSRQRSNMKMQNPIR